MADRSKKSKKKVTAAPTATPDIGGGHDRVLQAAIALFGAKGYAATSVRDIVNAAGVTAPTLYHHFGNKEGLFLAVMRATRARIAAEEQKVLAGDGSSTARIMRLGRTHLRLRRELADFGWAVLQFVASRPKETMRDEFRPIMASKIRGFEQLVEQGVASGEFRLCATHHVALALAGAVDIVSHPHAFEPDGAGPEEAMEGALATILSGITVDPAPPTPRRTASRRPARKRNPSRH